MAEALSAAHAIAVRLGARPLVDEVETLARTAHLCPDTVATLTSSPDRFSTEKASPRLVPLTEREREVLGHILAGSSNAEIARDLYISVKTVSVHVSTTLHRTGTGSRVEAAAWAARTARDQDGRSALLATAGDREQ